MIVSEASVPLVDNSFRVYPVGDLHLTLKTFRYKQLQGYLSTILADPAAACVQLGDVSDARDRSHRYFDPEMIHPRFKVDDVDILEDLIAEEAAELFLPLAKAGKMLGFLRGNHHQAGFTRRLCRMLTRESGHEVPDLGDRTMIRLKAQAEGRKSPEFSYTIYATHIDAGGRKPGAQANRQLDTQLSFDADLYLYGHSHNPSAQESVRYEVQRRGAPRLLARPKVHINAGAWLEPMALGNSYADAKALPPRAETVWYAEVGCGGKHREVSTTPKVWT